jgi:hypothetical protein
MRDEKCSRIAAATHCHVLMHSAQKVCELGQLKGVEFSTLQVFKQIPHVTVRGSWSLYESSSSTARMSDFNGFSLLAAESGHVKGSNPKEATS